MNTKQREILQVHRCLLVNNIIWTPALTRILRSQNIMTEGMISEIEGVEGQQTKVERLLDLLVLRPPGAFDKLTDALQMSGHPLLADLLREEVASKNPLNTKDMVTRLPFLARSMKEEERKQLEAYVSEKIQAGILLYSWQRDTKEKDKALAAKQEQLEQSHRHQQLLQQQHEQLLKAEKLAHEAQEESTCLKADLRALSETLERVEQQYKGQLDMQMRSNQATDSIAQRTNQRLVLAEKTLRLIQERLSLVVPLSSRDEEKDDMKRAENSFYFLPDDVDTFLAQFQKLLVARKEYEDLMKERDWIISHLDYHENGPGSLLSAFKHFTARNEEGIVQLKKELAKSSGMVEEFKAKLQDISCDREERTSRLAKGAAVWQNALLYVVRKQLQDAKAALRKKETAIRVKDEEIAKLHICITNLQQEFGHKTHKGPPQDNVNSSDRMEYSPDSNNSFSSNNRANVLPPLKIFRQHNISSSRRHSMVKARPIVSMVPGNLANPSTSRGKHIEGLLTTQIKIPGEKFEKKSNDPTRKVSQMDVFRGIPVNHLDKNAASEQGMPLLSQSRSQGGYLSKKPQE